MTLTVLSDDQIVDILENLTLEELEQFRYVLSSALHEYSTNSSASSNGPYQQPLRIYTEHPISRVTSAYMPSCGPEGMGCKVSLTAGEALKDPKAPFVRPTGTVNLFAPDGAPIGVLHASTLTAFRTALASACLLARRDAVRTVTVFGAGSQAYWHIRLALMMRGNTINNVNIITHSLSNSAKAISRKFAHISTEIKAREGWEQAQFSILTPASEEYDRLLENYVRAADVIYCCTPSRVDLFDGTLLTSREGRKKGRLIIAVGSFSPDMRELPEELILQAIGNYKKENEHFHKHEKEGGVIVVDALEGALSEAGEIVQAKVDPNHLVELGELLMLRSVAVRAAEETGTICSQTSMATPDSEKLLVDNKSPIILSGHGTKFECPFGSSESLDRNQKEDSLARWLRDGTVIFKSVGMGLLDLVVGMHVVKVAREKGVGTSVEGF